MEVRLSGCFRGSAGSVGTIMAVLGVSPPVFPVSTGHWGQQQVVQAAAPPTRNADPNLLAMLSGVPGNVAGVGEKSGDETPPRFRLLPNPSNLSFPLRLSVKNPPGSEARFHLRTSADDRRLLLRLSRNSSDKQTFVPLFDPA